MNFVSVIVGTYMVPLHGFEYCWHFEQVKLISAPRIQHMELGYQQEVFDISFEWVVNSKLVKTYYIRQFFCKTCKTRVRMEIMHYIQPCKTLCNDTWKVHNLECLTSFDQLCHLTYHALPHQRLHLLLFTHIN